MKHILDRAAYSALVSRHAALAQGQGGALRYDPAVVPFAATRDDAPEDVAALGRLLAPGQTAAFLQADPVVLPPELKRTVEADGVQMVAAAPFAPFEDERITQLGRADAADMLALATLTRPGPFTLRALDLGRFWGVREAGRLIAMAGERMAPSGYTELSGVCSHPDARGRGLGRLMSRYVAGRISAKGDTPFLHAFASNLPALRLYESIGFTLRRPVYLVVAGRA